MVDDLALGVLSAGAGARVDALLVDASPVGGALGADHTLRPAARRRADVLRKAGADSLTVVDFALAVGSTWRGVAGICRRRLDSCGHEKTRIKRNCYYR